MHCPEDNHDNHTIGKDDHDKDNHRKDNHNWDDHNKENHNKDNHDKDDHNKDNHNKDNLDQEDHNKGDDDKDTTPICFLFFPSSPPPPDWIQGYTNIALAAEVFMFPISFSPLIMKQILWNGRLHRWPDLLV